jgi:hypothetical protein
VQPTDPRRGFINTTINSAAILEINGQRGN